MHRVVIFRLSTSHTTQMIDFAPNLLFGLVNYSAHNLRLFSRHGHLTFLSGQLSPFGSHDLCKIISNVLILNQSVNF
jgi:hypothetical protein